MLKFAGRLDDRLTQKSFRMRRTTRPKSSCGLHRTTIFAGVPESCTSRTEWPNLESYRKTATDIGQNFVQFEGGGGGLGDPLKRDPNVVVKDLYDDYITQAMAEKAYGVVIDQNGRLDEERAKARREEIRNERLKKAIAPEERFNAEKEGLRFVRSSGEALHVKADASGRFYNCCSDCGTVLSGSNGAWAQSAATIVTKVSDTLGDYEMWVKERETAPYVNLHEFVCPECGSMLTVSTSVNE